MIGYVALVICFFIFGYQYVVRRKRIIRRTALITKYEWEMLGRNLGYSDQEPSAGDRFWYLAVCNIGRIEEQL